MTLSALLALLDPQSLQATVQVGGKVTASGEPISGVKVSIAPLLPPYEQGVLLLDRSIHAKPVDATRSGSDGRFSLAAPEPGMWIVRASKDGHPPMALELRPLLEDRALPPLELPTEGTLEIRVTGEGREPIEGARILLDSEGVPWYRSTPEGTWRLDRQLIATDKKGRASASVPFGEPLSLAAAATGFVPVSVKHSSGPHRAIRLQAAEGRPIRVTNHRGRPAREAIVWHAPSGQPIGRTDETGKVTLFDSPDRKASYRFLTAEAAALETLLPGAEGEPEDTNKPDSTLSVVLDPPKSIDGRVIAMPHRDPVPGAIVWHEGVQSHFAKSGPQGWFRLQELPWNENTLRWGAPGFLTDRLQRDRLPDPGAGPTLVLHRAGVIVGAVTDEEGRPLDDVEVRTRFDPRSLGPIRFNPAHWQRMSGGVARSGEGGRFRLGNLVPGLAYELRFQRNGFAPHRLTAEVEAGSSAPEELQVILERGTRAHGKVLDIDGEPIAGALATLHPAHPHDVLARARRMRDPLPAYTTATDDAGLFRFSNLPSGRVDLEVKAEGFASAEILGIEIQESAPPESDLGTVVLAPSARIQGRVESTSGEPISGVSVRVVPDVPLLALVQDQLEPAPDAVTAGDGWFELGGFEEGERVGLRFDREGFTTRVLRSARAGAEPSVVNLEPTRTLVGFVRSRRGAPIPDALVMVEESVVTSLSGGQIADAGKPTSLFDSTDKTGRFEIAGVSESPVRLYAQASGWQEWSGRVDPWSEPEGGEVEILLDPAAIVQGRVLGADGQPVVGAEVHRWAPALPPGAISYRKPLATADGDGAYRIDDLAPGPTRLEARHPAAGRSVREIDARPGENSVDFQLEGGYRVSGQVLDPSGLPAEGARVVLGSRLPSWTQPVTRADAAGLFSFDGVSTGRYELHAEQPGLGRSVEGISFEVADGPVEDLVVELAPLGTVSGRLFGLSVEDLGRVRLHAGALLDIGRVDHDGRYEIRGLAQGDWTIVAEIPRSELRATGRVRLDPEQSEATLNLDFDEGLVLTGRVQLAGEPGEGLVVTVYSSEGPVGWATTDRLGRFTVSGLASGEYRIEVTSTDRSIHLRRSLVLDSNRTILIQEHGTELSGSGGG